ncbi:hypothetical protein F5X96DRAFT_486255 [Biscogniauxia mediterranea]|nr:hypothetical protein F5X96DRAFT_486255 [Biscogniauxia mediterranea]
MESLDHDAGSIRGTKRKYSEDQAKLTGACNQPDTIQDDYQTPDALVQHRDDSYYQRLYDVEPDFRQLAQQDPDFGAVLKRGSLLDFNDPVSVMQLTKTLLKLDFGIQIDLPMDRLCPPVPNRHNYILWLKALLDSSAPSYSDRYDPTRRVKGLDIGTGASLIYPLLGCAQRPWSFIATDVDPKSLSYARKNAELNSYQTRIRIVDRGITDLLVPLDELGEDTIDFVMVNPPFYACEVELQDLARQKLRPPNSACTGAPVEMVCEGGEVGFVKRIIDESLVLRERVQWYTSMLGKQSSLDALVDTLKKNGITNYAVAAFIQGNRTRRWAVGWSFSSLRPAMSASRSPAPSITKKIQPYPTEMTIATAPASNKDVEQLSAAICNSLAAFDLVSWHWSEQRLRGVGFTDGNVWSRAYRRRKIREQRDMSSTKETAPNQPYIQPTRSTKKGQCTTSFAFGFAITINLDNDANEAYRKATVVLRWLQGNDYSLFESFAGVLRNIVRVGNPEKDFAHTTTSTFTGKANMLE